MYIQRNYPPTVTLWEFKCDHWLCYAKQLSQLTQILVSWASAMLKNWVGIHKCPCETANRVHLCYTVNQQGDRRRQSATTGLVNLHYSAVTQTETPVRSGILPSNATCHYTWHPDRSGSGGLFQEKTHRHDSSDANLHPTMFPAAVRTSRHRETDSVKAAADASSNKNYNHSKMEKRFHLASNNLIILST